MNWKKFIQQIWEWRVVWITAPSIAGIIILIRMTGWMQSIEWSAFDQLKRFRFSEPLDSRIVIVGIDETDITQLKQWPVSDEILAKALEKIKQKQPRVIGLDLYRNLPVAPGTENLNKIFETTPNLIGIAKKVGDRNNPPVPANQILEKLGQIGANDIPVDADGKVRRDFLYLTTPDNQTFESLPLRLALTYLAAEQITPMPSSANPDYLQLGKGVFTIFESNDGGYVGADARGYQILLSLRGPAQSFTTISLSDVLQDRISESLIRDRIVLIGATATSLNDYFYTAYSGGLVVAPQRTSGVELQANLASQVISAAIDGRPLIQVWPELLENLWILTWATFSTVVIWQWRYSGLLANRSFLRIGSIIFLACTGLIGGCYVSLIFGWWIPIVPPLFAFLTSAFVVTTYIAALEREERQVIMNLFGRHVTSDIAAVIWRDRDQFLRSGRLTAQKLVATVMFTDLVDFSAIAEYTEPEALMLWLNEYMEAMAQTVLDYGGVIDKFIGDSVMAVFGVPLAGNNPEEIAQDARQAVSCALQMADVLNQLNKKWKSQGRPTALMRVGIATGNVVTGSLGTAQRSEYTTIGDSVNVASRLESYEKSFQNSTCRILVNEETHKHLEDRLPSLKIGSVQLKGRKQPVEVYQVLSKSME